MMSLVMYMLFVLPVVFLSSEWVVLLLLLFLMCIMLNSSWCLTVYSFFSYSMGYDVLSFGLIILSLLITSLMILASSSVFSNRVGVSDFLFVVCLLLLFLMLSFSMSGIFSFYVFFEASIIPTMLLIFGWGYQPERLTAGLYLLFYTLFASLPLLLGIFYIYVSSGSVYYYGCYSFDSGVYLYLSMVMAFLISMPMFFFHFWLPKAHVEAPISGSMILAGVLLKLGGYGLLRITPFIYKTSVVLGYLFIAISLLGMVLVGLFCLFQTDIKSLIAYSSVSHMGLVVGGIFIMSYWGFFGSLVMMIGHGLCSSGLFCLANIIYERSHSRSFMINSGVISFMPSMSLFWFLLCVNNMAAPPSLNLVGEVFLIGGLVGWSLFSMLFLFISSFLSCCYSLFLYSYINHGSLYAGMSGLSNCQVREYMLVFFHWVPLNLLIMKCDVYSMWL
uniref:NADH-ubiquinone oxidoreductase chain 4 n=1 Tax=Embiophila sp. TaxID=2931291 RepID=A0A8T9ZY64_9HEMI|nr:NADH dehydrogenase subunit 4 [Embiophila sp.]